MKHINMISQKKCIKGKSYSHLAPVSFFFFSPPLFDCFPSLSFTIRGIVQHQTLQFGPLRVESLHQLVGVHRMAQVALWVRGGHSGQGIEFVGPAERPTTGYMLYIDHIVNAN